MSPEKGNGRLNPHSFAAPFSPSREGHLSSTKSDTAYVAYGYNTLCSLRQDLLMCLLFSIKTTIRFCLAYMNCLLSMGRLAVALLD